MRRNPAVAALAAVVAVVLLAGVAVSASFAVAARWEANRANEKTAEAEEESKAARKAEEDAERQKRRAEVQLDRAERLVYAGKLALAQQSFAEENGELTLQYLDECQWDLRGWEHDHLWTRFNSKATLRGHTGGVHGVAFSPDGKRIHAQDEAGKVSTWDARSGGLLGDAPKPVLERHGRPTERRATVTPLPPRIARPAASSGLAGPPA